MAIDMAKTLMKDFQFKPMASVVKTLLFFLALLIPSLHTIEADIGVCYGKYYADNLPSPEDVVNLYNLNNIKAMRIYDLDEEILRAVQGTDIKLAIAVPNVISTVDEYLHLVGSNFSAAVEFVENLVVPYYCSIKYIVVGNEVYTTSPNQVPWVVPAMQNVLKALRLVNLAGKIKVTTAIETSLLKNSYPPSNGEFNDTGYMGPIANFLYKNRFPLFLNVYPSLAGNVSDLDYVLLNRTTPKFTDPNNHLKYYNLFDATVDATYAALDKVLSVSSTTAVSNSGAKHHVSVTGSETGRSSGGFSPHMMGMGGGIPPQPHTDNTLTLENAQVYYSNVIKHAKKGTPLKPGPMEIFLFEMFDEDKKKNEEAHYGLFYPDGQCKYRLDFN